MERTGLVAGSRATPDALRMWHERGFHREIFEISTIYFEDAAENTSENGAEVIEILVKATRKHYYVVEIREAELTDEASQKGHH